MASKPVYWLDTNALIAAKDGPFRFELAPAFWAALDKHAQSGRIKIPKMVYDEIVEDGMGDQLASWLKLRKSSGFCVKADEKVQDAFRKIADHVVANYSSPFAAEFLGEADPWVIAYAMESKGVVVTFEKVSFGAKKVKIPNVCSAMSVPRINLYDMLEALGVKFV